MMKPWSSLTLAGLLACSSAAYAKDLIETARSAGHFTILLKAAEAAGMDGMLTQPGPYTVFAPTDDAFKALPAGMLDMLMKPENKAMLTKVLGYHVLFGSLTTKDLVADKSAANSTIGMPVILQKKTGAVMADDAKITQPDIVADNGVVQVIDKVLLPAMPVQPRT